MQRISKEYSFLGALHSTCICLGSFLMFSCKGFEGEGQNDDGNDDDNDDNDNLFVKVTLWK